MLKFTSCLLVSIVLHSIAAQNNDECLMEENTDYPGMDLNLQTGRTTDRRNSALACRDLCNQNKDCKYFGWKAQSRECWLKTGISGTVVESGTTSGMACKKTGKERISENFIRTKVFDH